jgi:GT2 family glycosyltransferase
VLVLNLNGREHLKSCLPTLEAQTYPRNCYEIVVVDNGSTDGSLTFVRDRHPNVRLISYRSNRGFAEAYNVAAGLCQTEFVAFLNNDTRVAPNWLAALVATVNRHGAACAASRILDWTGERIDFAGGDVSFLGHSWQRDAGQPATKEYEEDKLLFACGASMLVRRTIFLDAGGFDPQFFAYFEDVDLGWRLALLGHPTVFAPSAVTYHRLHGTAGRWASAPFLRLYERNALMMIYKNYEQQTLDRVFPVAVALTIARASAHTALDPQTFEFGNPIPDSVPLSPRTIAQLIGLEDFACQLPVLAGKRQEIQRRRKRTDVELLPLFSDPLRLHDVGAGYERTACSLIAEFEIDEWFEADIRARDATTLQAPPSTSTAKFEEDQPPVQQSGGQGGAEPPLVTIVILVAGTPGHLPDCLASLRVQTYPPGSREVIVVDNGSVEDPTGVVERHYPGARVIRNATNLGFAAGNNVGARAAKGQYVAFLNDDTKAHREWLAELVKMARRRRVACVASQILTWDGLHIDFGGGSVNFEGKGFQSNYGQAATIGSEQPLLFANGAGMLVDREVFVNAGGWDEGTFAYYEDVELGWRLWLLGAEVWLAPHATVFHKHHGTAGRWSEVSRVRLYERNALRMLYTHLERENLARVLPAALLLSADRVLLETGFGRDGWKQQGTKGMAPARLGAPRRLAAASRGLPRYFKREIVARGALKHLSALENLRRVGARGLLGATKSAIREVVQSARPGASRARAAYLVERGAQNRVFDRSNEPVSATSGAGLLGVTEFLHSLPHLERRRRWLQARRRRSDLAILAAFNQHWLSHSPSAHQRAHDELQRLLVEMFRIGEIAGFHTTKQSLDLEGTSTGRTAEPVLKWVP